MKTKTANTLRAAKGDNGASAVLVAVVQEFDKKADKAMRQGDTPSRDAGSSRRIGAGGR